MKQDAAMHSVTSLNTSSEEGSTPPISFGPDAEEAEELVIYAFIYLFIYFSPRLEQHERWRKRDSRLHDEVRLFRK